MQVVDSSVVIASLVHADQGVRAACRAHVDASPLAIGHVLSESYARITALPGCHRLAPAIARQVLQDMFPEPPLTLSSPGYLRVIELVASLGVPGGAIFDCVIAEAAREHGAALVSLDRRASKNYAAVGVDFTIL